MPFLNIQDKDHGKKDTNVNPDPLRIVEFQWVCYDEIVIEPRRFMTKSLLDIHEGIIVTRILNAALQAVDPGSALANLVKRDGEWLTVGDWIYDLRTYRRIFVVGAGKASLAMANKLEPMLNVHLVDGVIITKSGSEISQSSLEKKENLSKIRNLPGSHPVPDMLSLTATRQLVSLVSGLQDTDLVICLISGGGSALLTMPVEGVSLADIQSITRQLLACGANIVEINTIRKHLDRVKGGGLARLIYPARSAVLILSDVVGNPLDVIASGPTTPDASTYQDAVDIVHRYRLWDDLPLAVRSLFTNGAEGRNPETLKAGDYRLAPVQNLVIASNQQACEAACIQAGKEGLHSQLLTTYLQGEAHKAGSFLAAVLKQVAIYGQPVRRPACLVAGGETTVILQGNGMGGRNQEVALGAVKPLGGLDRIAFVTLATDGEDGPTDAAGAVVTGKSQERASKAGLQPEHFSNDNNSYAFFNHLDDLIKIGPTGTNVNDMTFLFAF